MSDTSRSWQNPGVANDMQTAADARVIAASHASGRAAFFS
jgi:hypothetical protein